MEKPQFKVGDEVMYIGDGVNAKIITILEIEGNKYWNDYHNHRTYCTINEIRKLTKLERALK